MEKERKDRRYNPWAVGAVMVIALGMLLVFDAGSLDTWAGRIKDDTARGIFSTVTKPWSEAAANMGALDFHKTVQSSFRDFANAPPISTWFTIPDLSKIARESSQTRDEAVEFITKSLPKEVVYSAEKPLRVLMIGDSMAGLYTAQVFRSLSKQQPALDLDILQKISSTLSEPKYFNWPVEIVRAFSQKTYDVVFILLGSNDAQSIRLPKGYVNFGTPEWNTEYQNRTNSFLDTILSKAKKAYWVGVPPMTQRLPGYRERMKSLNQLLQGICAARENIRFIPTDDLLGDANRNYTDALPVDGQLRVVRMTDGIHLEYYGAVLLIRRFLDNLAVDFPSAVKR